nr:PREDICTED: uncharacterized protein LOC109042844 isoform X3 [Bemisia tabaci]
MSTKCLSTVFLARASILIVSILNVEAKKRPKWWMTTSKPVPTARPRTQPEIEALLKKDGIIPDVIKYAPNDTVQIVYNNNETVVDCGNELTFKDVKNAPTFVDWFLHDEYEVYTLMLLGPDSPTRENPSNRCYKHWLVANIPEERIYAAEEFASYTISTRAYEPVSALKEYFQKNYRHPPICFCDVQTARTVSAGVPRRENLQKCHRRQARQFLCNGLGGKVQSWDSKCCELF